MKPKDGDRVRYTIEGTYRNGDVSPDGSRWFNRILDEGTVKVLEPALPPEVEGATLGVLKGAKITVDGKDYTVSGYAAIPIEPPTPALPPEPPVGTIGYVDGNPVQRAGNLWWLYGDGVISLEWAEIADRFVPAINLAEAEAWLNLQGWGTGLRDSFRAKFGGASDE